MRSGVKRTGVQLVGLAVLAFISLAGAPQAQPAEPPGGPVPDSLGASAEVTSCSLALAKPALRDIQTYLEREGAAFEERFNEALTGSDCDETQLSELLLEHGFQFRERTFTGRPIFSYSEFDPTVVGIIDWMLDMRYEVVLFFDASGQFERSNWSASK